MIIEFILKHFNEHNILRMNLIELMCSMIDN